MGEDDVTQWKEVRRTEMPVAVETKLYVNFYRYDRKAKDFPEWLVIEIGLGKVKYNHERYLLECYNANGIEVAGLGTVLVQELTGRINVYTPDEFAARYYVHNEQ